MSAVVTELRVHGVTGSPAESTLDRPLVHRVAGDDEAAFLRPREEYGPTTGPGGVTLEAYRWGNLTAGAAARALWLLLLPFMFANVAIWLRPAGDRAKNLFRALSRIFALSVTAYFVLTMTGISVDLVAWQCLTSAPCVDGREYLAPLAEGVLAPVGRRMAVLAVVPILIVAFLWFLGRRTWTRYEEYPLQTTGMGDGLSHPCFWNGAPLVGRLRAIHIAVAFGTLDSVLLGVLVPRDRAPFGYVLAVAVGLLLVLCVVAVCLTPMMHRDTPAGWAGTAAKTLRFVAILLTVLTLGYAVAPRADWRATGGLPGYGTTLTALFAAQLALLLVLGGVILAVRPRGSFLNGLAAPVAASIGLGTAVAFSAGLSFRVADFLNRGWAPSSPQYPSAEAQPLQPPLSYEWSALGFCFMLLVVAAVVGIARVGLERRLRRRAREATDGDFPGGRGTDGERAAGIDRAIAGARVTDHMGPLLAWGYTPLAVAALIVTGLAIAGVRPVQLAAPGSLAGQLLSVGVNLGTYLIGLAALGLVVIGLLAYRYRRFRRIVGVLWDLGTFWPRAAHPLAPPCYAERAVPELVIRGSWLARHGGVVISGHSQGSVLAAATVLQLPPEAGANAALLTYGSPLRRLYARLFPAYVNDELLDRIGAAVADPDRPVRWVNLWRHTDPIGGPIGGPANDVRLVDPAEFGFPSGDTVFAQLHRHGEYQLDPAFGDAVSSVVVDLPVSLDRSTHPDLSARRDPLTHPDLPASRTRPADPPTGSDPADRPPGRFESEDSHRIPEQRQHPGVEPGGGPPPGVVPPE